MKKVSLFLLFALSSAIFAETIVVYNQAGPHGIHRSILNYAKKQLNSKCPMNSIDFSRLNAEEKMYAHLASYRTEEIEGTKKKKMKLVYKMSTYKDRSIVDKSAVPAVISINLTSEVLENGDVEIEDGVFRVNSFTDGFCH